jgi:hypothetical protein
LYLEADVVTFVVGGRLLERHDKDREKGNYLVEEDDGGVGATFGVIYGNAIARYDQKTKIRCGEAYGNLDLSTACVRIP